MGQRDEVEVDEQFKAWADQQALAPTVWKYPPPGRWDRRISTAVAVVVSALFWAAVIFGMVRCVGQVMAQPTVQRLFDRGAPPRSAPAPEQPREALTGPSDAEIAKRLIAESIAGYDGPCACPYQHDRAGRSCGRRSAYNRPRGAKPLCSETDVTQEMLAAARDRR